MFSLVVMYVSHRVSSYIKLHIEIGVWINPNQHVRSNLIPDKSENIGSLLKYKDLENTVLLKYT